MYEITGVFCLCMCVCVELQLAALLGKTLLEKNEELESKLKKLQEFAKETILANQVSCGSCHGKHYMHAIFSDLR